MKICEEDKIVNNTEMTINCRPSFDEILLNENFCAFILTSMSLKDTGDCILWFRMYVRIFDCYKNR